MLILLAAGCSSVPEESDLTKNQRSIQNPKLVAKMTDGRNLFRIVIQSESHWYPHYVYYFSTNDLKTISVNYAEREGKITVNKTIILDGKEFELVPKKP